MKKNPDSGLSALFAEAVRAAVLTERPAPENGLFETEDTAVLAALWALYNPTDCPGRKTSFFALLASDAPADPALPPTPPRRKYFSAHAHPGEPLTESPDDLVKYHLLDLEHGAGTAYILDGPDGIKIG